MRKEKNITGLSIRIHDDDTFQLFRNGIAQGSKFERTEGNLYRLNDEIFDVDCMAVPENETFLFEFTENGIDSWIKIIDFTRKGKKVQFCFFLCLYENGHLHYNLNYYIVLNKILRNAGKHRFTWHNYYSEESPTTSAYRIYSADGTIREKILEGILILNKLKKDAETEVLKMLKKEIFYSLDASKPVPPQKFLDWSK